MSSSNTSKRIMTVGHSNHSWEHFVDILQRNRVEAIAEVRSYPYSNYSPQFDREALKAALAKEGIQYMDLGNELGGRPEGVQFYDHEGHVRYDQLAEAASFQAGLERLEQAVSRHTVAVLCSEEDPAVCHRALLVGRVLRERGYEVEHVRGDGTRQSDREVFPPAGKAAQGSLFDYAKEEEWKSIPSVLPKRKRNNSSDF